MWVLYTPANLEWPKLLRPQSTDAAITSVLRGHASQERTP
jgi:hypothetical protein